MLRLATVFSGIGSVEWALKRMGVEHKIIFACDNGEIDFKDLDADQLKKDVFKLRTLKKQQDYINKLLTNQRRTNFVKQSYLANYEIDEMNFHHDIRFLDGVKYRGQVDLLVGGSPCQSFSIMGYKKGLDDIRGTLFYEYARLVKEIQPKVFIFENVQGLVQHDNGRTWEIIQDVFHDLGYNITSTIMDAKECGIPQTRRRLIVVGFRNENIEFPAPSPIKLKFTLQDFLENNTKYGNFLSKNGKIVIKKEPAEVDDKYYLSEAVLRHVMATGSKGYYIKPKIDLTVARPLLATMHKMHRAGVDNYVTYKGKVRKLTPRECMRLMGYDDSFKIVVSDLQAYRQAGNSIVVDMMIKILNEIFSVEDFK